MAYIIGVDTGGTFTDIVGIDERGKVTAAKALTTPPHFEEGVISAIGVLAAKLGLTTEELLQQTESFRFGTTVGVNTLITRKGAKTGFITTAGNEDVLHIGRAVSRWAGLSESDIKHVYRLQKVEPLVPKNLIEGIAERVDYSGSEIVPLNEEEARKAIKRLVDKGAESIAICLLWSQNNPDHENKVESLIRKDYPSVYVSKSNRIAPNIGEYERSNSAVLDAFVGPVTMNFLMKLDELLIKKGLQGPLLLMQASGGVVYADQALAFAAFQSGPTAGVIGSKYLGSLLGHSNIITTDVGGTSFDVSAIAGGSLTYAREPVIERHAVHLPMVDIASIGLAGGSIIWTDQTTKLIHIGPQSAGASPGPACYNFGGEEPTLTDAALILGYINPDYFLGGKMKLYPDLADKALRKVGDRVDLGAIKIATAAYEIACSQMADLLRLCTVQRGYDPREFVLLAYGGAGPIFGAEYGRYLGIKEMCFPATASTYSAFGLTTADLFHTHSSQAHLQMPANAHVVNDAFEKLEQVLNEELTKDGIEEKNREITYSVDMRYGLQVHVVRVPVERKRFGPEDMDIINRKFDEAYERLYGKGSGYVNAGRFILGFRADGIGRIPKPGLAELKDMGQDANRALKGKRECFFIETKRFVPTSIYDYGKLQCGNLIGGPGIIEAEHTSMVIPPGFSGWVDKYLNVVIQFKGV